jgi:hypothetical protein
VKRAKTKRKLFFCPSERDEGRKRTILIAASALVSGKYAQSDGEFSPALDAAIADAITLAKQIMRTTVGS